MNRILKSLTLLVAAVAVIVPLAVQQTSAHVDPIADAPEQIQTQECAYVPQRVFTNQLARVIPGPSNNLRAQPNTSSAVVGQIPGGSVVTVVNTGLVCNQAINWVLVNYNGVQGWTAEAQGSSYYLEPYNLPATPVGQFCPLPSRLSSGTLGLVLPGPSNNIRGNPTFNSQVIGSIPENRVFNVIGGPVCQDGVYWLQVNFLGTIGWTAEGQNGRYFVEFWAYPTAVPQNPPPTVTPVPPPSNGACGTLPPRLVIGQGGQITPGLPNLLRSAPRTIFSGIVGRIPAGGVFTVLDGPVCGDGYYWWRVNYNGRVGWTAESGFGNYWAVPIGG